MIYNNIINTNNIIGKTKIRDNKSRKCVTRKETGIFLPVKPMQKKYKKGSSKLEI